MLWFILLTALVVDAPPAETLTATTLTTPDAIQADGNGFFTSTGTLTFGSDGGAFAYSQCIGETNVSGGVISDGFCFEWYEPGHELEISISGHLTDPSLPGEVRLDVAVCQEPGQPDLFFTRIIPVQQSPVDNDVGSFGMLKGRFR